MTAYLTAVTVASMIFDLTCSSIVGYNAFPQPLFLSQQYITPPQAYPVQYYDPYSTPYDVPFYNHIVQSPPVPQQAARYEVPRYDVDHIRFDQGNTEFFSGPENPYRGFAYQTRNNDGATSQVVFVTGSNSGGILEKSKFFRSPKRIQEKSTVKSQTSTEIARTIASSLLDPTTRSADSKLQKSAIIKSSPRRELPTGIEHFYVSNNNLQNYLQDFTKSIFQNNIPDINFETPGSFQYQVITGPGSSHTTYYKSSSQNSFNNVQPEESVRSSVVAIDLRNNFVNDNEGKTSTLSYNTKGSGETEDTTIINATTESEYTDDKDILDTTNRENGANNKQIARSEFLNMPEATTNVEEINSTTDAIREEVNSTYDSLKTSTAESTTITTEETTATATSTETNTTTKL